MESFNKEYIAAIVLVVISVLKMFGLEIGSDVVTAIVTGAVAIYLAVKQITNKKSTVLGKKI